MRGSTAAVLASRTRQRREARIRENYDRIFASLINPDSSKFAARHPTRVIPDVPGIFGLSKTEIKKDSKEIEKCNLMSHIPDFQDDEEISKTVVTSFHPTVPEQSKLSKKHARFANCLNMKSEPGIAQVSTAAPLMNSMRQEISSLKSQVTASRLKLQQLEQSNEDYLHSFHLTRSYLTDLLSFINLHYYHPLQLLIKTLLKNIISECSNEWNASSQVFPSLPTNLAGNTAVSNPAMMNFQLILTELFTRENERKKLNSEISNLLASITSSSSFSASFASSSCATPSSEGSGSGKSKESKNKGASAQAANASIPCISIDLASIQALPGYENFQINNSNTAPSSSLPADSLENNKEYQDLLKSFNSLQSSMIRDEELLSDLEIFFQDILKEDSGGDHNKGFLESLLLNSPDFMNKTSLLSSTVTTTNNPPATATVSPVKVKVEPGVPSAMPSSLPPIGRDLSSTSSSANEENKEIIDIVNTLLSSSTGTNSEALCHNYCQYVLNTLDVLSSGAATLNSVINPAGSKGNEASGEINESSATAAGTESGGGNENLGNSKVVESLVAGRKKRKTTSSFASQPNPSDNHPTTASTFNNSTSNMDLIQLRSFVRSRIAHDNDALLLFSPFSLYEHRYLGVLPKEIKTLFVPNNAPNGSNGQEIEDKYSLKVVQSPVVTDVENELMNNLLLQTSIAIQRNIMKKLQLSNEELEKLVTESSQSLQKTKNLHSIILQDDYNERLKMKNTLTQYGLSSSSSSSNNAAANGETTNNAKSTTSESLLSQSSTVMDEETRVVAPASAPPTTVPSSLPPAIKGKRGTYPRNKGQQQQAQHPPQSSTPTTPGDAPVDGGGGSGAESITGPTGKGIGNKRKSFSGTDLQTQTTSGNSTTAATSSDVGNPVKRKRT